MSTHGYTIIEQPVARDLLEVPLQFRCIVLKPGRRHVSTHGYTIIEQPVARDLFQSLAAGIMLVEPQ